MRSSEATLNPPNRAADESGRVDGEPGAPRAGADRRRAPMRKREPAQTVSLILRVVAGLLIVAVAILIAAGLMANRRQALQAPVDEVVRRVRAVEAVPRPAESVWRVWEGFGTARAKDQAEVAAEVSGRVVARPDRIDPGVAISAGEVLVRLDDSDYRERMQAAQSAAAALAAQINGLDVEHGRLQEQVAQAEEQLRLTRREMERLEEARAGGAATELELIRLQGAVARQEGERLRLEQQLDSIPSRRAGLEAELSARRNEAAVAERQLTRTVVVSPIDGVLQSIDAHVGEMIQAGQRIARVVDLGRIEIPLRLPASAQGEIGIGHVATVRTGGAGVGNGLGREWPARVARIAPEADPETRTVTVFLEVEQSSLVRSASGGRGSSWSDLLMPGRFVSAEVAARAGNGEMLIVVPRRAVVDDRVWVAVMNDEGASRAQPRQVRVLYHVDARFLELDRDETQWAVIGAGVRPGERVIVTNLDELVPGARVEVVAADAG